MIDKIKDRKRPNLGLYKGADGNYTNPIDCPINYKGAEISILQALKLTHRRYEEQSKAMSALSERLKEIETAFSKLSEALEE